MLIYYKVHIGDEELSTIGEILCFPLIVLLFILHFLPNILVSIHSVFYK